MCGDFLPSFHPISSKIDLPKAFKKQLQIFQNLDHIVAKMVQNQGLEGVWGAFGLLWGRSWASFGSEAPVGRSLGAFWATLGRLWKRLWRLLGRLGHQVEASWGVLEASWRCPAWIFTLRVILYLRPSGLMDFCIEKCLILDPFSEGRKPTKR